MPQNTDSTRSDPLRDFRFQVEIDGLIFGGFSEVSGLSVEVETETYTEGGVNGFVHILPKSIKYKNIVLKKGIVQDNELWLWIQELMKGAIKPRNVSILLLNEDDSTACFWGVENAYPVKWTGSELKGSGGGIFIETLELSHQGLTKL